MDNGDEGFELADFLTANYELFTLLGVFGAIAVYLAQFTVNVENTWTKVGQVSSLIIFALIAWAIRNRLEDRLDSSIFDFLIKPRRESYAVLVFVVLYYLLILSVLTIALQYPSAGTVVIQAILVFLGISHFLWLLTRIGIVLGFGEDLGTLGEDDRIVRYARYMLILCGVVFFSSAAALLYLQTKFGYGINSVVEQSPGPGVVPFLVAYFVGILSGALMFSIIALLLSMSHVMFRAILDWEHGEEFLRAYQVFQGNDELNRQSELTDFDGDP